MFTEQTAQVKPCSPQLWVSNLCNPQSQPPPATPVSPPTPKNYKQGLVVGTCIRDLHTFEVSASVLLCDQNWLVRLETPVFPLLSWSFSLLRRFLGISGDFYKWHSMHAPRCLCARCRDNTSRGSICPILKHHLSKGRKLLQF